MLSLNSILQLLQATVLQKKIPFFICTTFVSICVKTCSILMTSRIYSYAGNDRTIEKRNCGNLFLILLLFSLSSNMGFIPMLKVPSFQLELS